MQADVFKLVQKVYDGLSRLRLLFLLQYIRQDGIVGKWMAALRNFSV